MRLNQVTVEVADIARSVAFYQGLGLTLIVSSPHYARFLCGEEDEASSTFSIHIAEAVRPVMGGIYFECENLDARVAELKVKGIDFDTDPVDQSWLWREAWLRDPDGNRICLFNAGENRINPPWRVPR